MNPTVLKGEGEFGYNEPNGKQITHEGLEKLSTEHAQIAT